jgi:hypothetical protein
MSSSVRPCRTPRALTPSVSSAPRYPETLRVVRDVAPYKAVRLQVYQAVERPRGVEQAGRLTANGHFAMAADKGLAALV